MNINAFGVKRGFDFVVDAVKAVIVIALGAIVLKEILIVGFL